MYLVAIRRDGSSWSVICRTWSRPYALAVGRKWRKRGYDTLLEEVQQEDE